MNQTGIRLENLCRVWALLRQEPPLTRQKIAEKTRLSLMTVTNLVDCLDRFGTLSFEPDLSQRRSAGRRADRIRLCDDRHAWVALDLTDIYFRCRIMTLNLRPLPASFEHLYDEGKGYAENLAAFLRRVCGTLETESRRRTVTGVAVITPGPYDATRDCIRNKRIPQLNGIALRERLQKEVGDYPYYVDEDVKFSVRAFAPLHAEGEGGVLYYLYMGEGVGGAVLHNAKLLRGRNAVSGDASQLLFPNGESVESRLSLRAFARECGIEADSSMDSDDVQRSIDECAERDFPTFEKALLRCADRTADLLHTVSWLLDPAQIVLDCPYLHAHRERFARQVKEKLCALLGGAIEEAQIVLPPTEMRSVLLGAEQVLSRKWIERMLETAEKEG